MIITPKDIYKSVAQKHQVPLEIIESIGTIVFESVRDSLTNATSLAYELPHIGTFNLRCSKFDNFYSSFTKLLDEKDLKAILQLNENPERYKNNTELYEKLLEFRNDKLKTRQKRNEYDNTIESSEDNFEKH